jgi:hypothetical protein
MWKVLSWFSVSPIMGFSESVNEPSSILHEYRQFLNHPSNKDYQPLKKDSVPCS